MVAHMKFLVVSAFLTMTNAYSVSVMTNATNAGKVAQTTAVAVPKPVKGPKIGPNDSICDALSMLPSFCSCTPTSGGGGKATCSVDVIGIDTIGVVMDFEPCALPMKFNLDITEADLGIDYPIADLSAGTTEKIVVPGLTIGIPGLVGASIYMDINISGDISQLTFKVGVDACAQIPVFGLECASSLGIGLPIWLLNAELDFSDFCPVHPSPALETVDA